MCCSCAVVELLLVKNPHQICNNLQRLLGVSNISLAIFLPRSARSPSKLTSIGVFLFGEFIGPVIFAIHIVDRVGHESLIIMCNIWHIYTSLSNAWRQLLKESARSQQMRDVIDEEYIKYKANTTEKRNEAVFMWNHERLGAESLIFGLDEELLRMILTRINGTSEDR